MHAANDPQVHLAQVHQCLLHFAGQTLQQLLYVEPFGEQLRRSPAARHARAIREVGAMFVDVYNERRLDVHMLGGTDDPDDLFGYAMVYRPEGHDAPPATLQYLFIQEAARGVGRGRNLLLATADCYDELDAVVPWDLTDLFETSGFWIAAEFNGHRDPDAPQAVKAWITQMEMHKGNADPDNFDDDDFRSPPLLMLSDADLLRLGNFLQGLPS